MNAPASEIRGLVKRFGAQPVLRGIDLAVHAGEHVALVGNNGQGKTTLLRLVLGLLRPDAGEVLLEGRPAGHPRAGAQKRAVGYLPESVAFYPNLTGRQTLGFLGRLKGHAGSRADLHAEVERLLERVGLAAVGNRKVRHYSKGMCQRLGLAQALLGRPRLLLLDEPTNGLDPQGVHAFYDILGRLQHDGVAILTASHVLSELEPRVSRLAVLRDGAIERCGTVGELAAALRLPGTVKFSLRDRQARPPAELERYGPRRADNGVPNTYLVRVPPAERFAVLDILLHHAGEIGTLTVTEPGMEELFRAIHLDVGEEMQEVRP